MDAGPRKEDCWWLWKIRKYSNWSLSMRQIPAVSTSRPDCRRRDGRQTPHSLVEQYTFTAGRIVVRGNKAKRRPGKRADYLLRYTRDFPIAVVEAKAEELPAAQGIEQAKEYAEVLSLSFAYA